MPTLSPGCHLVPRWRAKILPASTCSPPYFLIPSRRPAVSRPLREEPPAFLCAMTMFPSCGDETSAADDLLDAYRRLLLAVPALAARVLAATRLECDDLWRAALLDDFGSDFGARKDRRANFRLGHAGHHQHLGELHQRAGLPRDLLDREHVVSRHAILLAASLDDSVHLCFPLIMSAIPGADTAPGPGVAPGPGPIGAHYHRVLP